MPDSDPTQARVERLEEALSYAQHDIEQLSGELVRAFDEIKRLKRAIERLENRLETAIEKEDFPDALEDLPPHAMGPRPRPSNEAPSTDPE